MTTHPVLPPLDAYRLWARAWDTDPSAIVALESRHLAPWLADVNGRRVLDISCGTGRWLEHAAARGARVTGLDFCAEMLHRACAKPGLAKRLALADATRLPVQDGCADIVLCTLSLGHVPDAAAVMREMARALAPRGIAIVSDFHPEAFRRGWKRTFRSAGRTYEIENHYHAPDKLLAAANACNLVLEETREPGFGEPERAIFIAACRPELFDEVCEIPAVWLARWRKRA